MNHSSLKFFVGILMLILNSNCTLLAQDLQYDLPYDMSYYQEEIGKTFLFYVTGSNDSECWGGEENVYTIDSPLGVAAVHAGLLKVNEINLIKVKVLEGRESYPSVTRNGITSGEHESSDGSYQLSAPEPGDIANAPTTMSDYLGKFGFTFVFRVKAHKDGSIWGGKDNVYTSDSEIATAAVHAGLLKPGETGIVRLRMLEGRRAYPAVTRNGLTSHDYEDWEGSYQFVKEEEQDKK